MSYYFQMNDNNVVRFVTPEDAESNTGWLSLCQAIGRLMAAWNEEDALLGQSTDLCGQSKREDIWAEINQWEMQKGEHAYDSLPWTILLPAMGRMPETRIKIWADFIGPMAWPWILS